MGPTAMREFICCTSQARSPSSSLAKIVRKIWPATAIVLGFTLAIIRMCFLGYELIKENLRRAGWSSARKSIHPSERRWRPWRRPGSLLGSWSDRATRLEKDPHRFDRDRDWRWSVGFSDYAVRGLWFEGLPGATVTACCRVARRTWALKMGTGRRNSHITLDLSHTLFSALTRWVK